MSDNQRLQLSNMIKANNVQDQTESIRALKHSPFIRMDVNQLILLKAKHRDDEKQLYEDAISECNFLFTYYFDIFNKLRKDELDVGILHQFLDVLEKIEQGELDQHEGSFAVGTLLKKLYVDSALKRAEKLDQEEENKRTSEPAPQKTAPKAISWNDYKKSLKNK